MSSAFQLERLCTGQTVLPLVSCRSGSSQNFKQSQKHLRHSPRSQRCLQTSVDGMAARRKQGPAAWPSQDSRRALLLRSETALGSTMAVVVEALDMDRERIPATRTVSSLQQSAMFLLSQKPR